MARQAAYITVTDRRSLYETRRIGCSAIQMQPNPTQFEVELRSASMDSVKLPCRCHSRPMLYLTESNEMAKIESSILIKRPTEEVFAVLSNSENNPKWQSGSLENRKTSSGPIGVGTTWHSVSQFLGRRIEGESEITEYEPNRKYTLKSKLPFPVEARTTFERVEGGTRINLKTEVEIGGFFKLAEPLVVSMGKRQFEGDLANLKDLMEAHAV
ncbi:MAG TPA: SRPBCC family protein [Anaerolineae bacterium]|nr:SRPBCC family protein [Anaerolineae bacterium]